MKVSSKETRLPTSTTCLDCHDAQGEFWQGTSHLAYKTLVNNNAENDLSCLVVTQSPWGKTWIFLAEGYGCDER